MCSELGRRRTGPPSGPGSEPLGHSANQSAGIRVTVSLSSDRTQRSPGDGDDDDEVMNSGAWEGEGRLNGFHSFKEEEGN